MTLLYIYIYFLKTAKKFGVTEFVNPKDHNKPVQEVCFTFFIKKLSFFLFIACLFSCHVHVMMNVIKSGDC